jgi:hypothetical protein
MIQHTVNAHGVDPATVTQAHADRVAVALGLVGAQIMQGFITAACPGWLTVTREPIIGQLVSLPWSLVAGLGDLRARPLEWTGPDGREPALQGDWYDRSMGFHIGFDAEEPEGEQFAAAWGEGDPEQFATLEAAQQWCQQQADDFIRDTAIHYSRTTNEADHG